MKQDNGAPKKQAGRVRVLYTDDHQDYLEIVKAILEREGEFSVDATVSGREALELLRSRDYDVILSDYRMARMDGDEFLRKIRMIDPGVPFIFFTGKDRDEVSIEPSDDGSISYMQKRGDPAVTFAELKNLIRTVISQREYALPPSVQTP